MVVDGQNSQNGGIDFVPLLFGGCWTNLLHVPAKFIDLDGLEFPPTLVRDSRIGTFILDGIQQCHAELMQYDPRLFENERQHEYTARMLETFHRNTMKDVYSNWHQPGRGKTVHNLQTQTRALKYLADYQILLNVGDKLSMAKSHVNLWAAITTMNMDKPYIGDIAFAFLRKRVSRYEKLVRVHGGQLAVSRQLLLELIEDHDPHRQCDYWNNYLTKDGRQADSSLREVFRTICLGLGNPMELQRLYQTARDSVSYWSAHHD